MAVNLQSGISYRSFDGGNTMTVPIGAAVSFKGSESHVVVCRWLVVVDIV